MTVAKYKTGTLYVSFQHEDKSGKVYYSCTRTDVFVDYPSTFCCYYTLKTLTKECKLSKGHTPTIILVSDLHIDTFLLLSSSICLSNYLFVRQNLRQWRLSKVVSWNNASKWRDWYLRLECQVFALSVTWGHEQHKVWKSWAWVK